MERQKGPNGGGDPYRLRGLEQAIYLLEELCGGCEKNELIRSMHGDKQLVDLWMNFLQHNHWIAHDESSISSWVLTDKGRRWVRQIKKVLPRKALGKKSVGA